MAGRVLRNTVLGVADRVGSSRAAWSRLSLRLTGNRIGQVALPSAAGALAVGTGPAGVPVVNAAGLAAVGLAARRIEHRSSG